MTRTFKGHFPTNKSKWSIYLKALLPMIIGSALFALNGVVDNFMVGHINQGVTALGAINSWTNILIGWLAGTAAVGSVLLSQFYHARKYQRVQEIARYRYYLSYLFAVPLAIMAWISPDILTHLFYGKANAAIDNAAYLTVMENARNYAHVIAFQWLLMAATFNLGNQMRELGYGKHTMYWGIGTLTANISLNATLMYGFNFGVEGAAFASVAGRLVAFSYGLIFVYSKRLAISFKVWSIFHVSWATRVLFWKRWMYFFSIATVFVFIQFRNIFYSQGYPVGSLGIGVSGLSVVSLTGALVNVFTTTFNALGAMAAMFVGAQLGKGNFENARKNSDQLKGFNTIIATFLAMAIVVFAFFIPHMNFLSRTKYDIDGNVIFAGQDQLMQVKWSLMVIAAFYPVWIWFSTSYRNGNSGGRGSFFAVVDWIITGAQVGWAAITMLLIAPSSDYMQMYFWLPYVIFFSSDFIKLLLQEIYYYKTDYWLHSITKEEEEKLLKQAQDRIGIETPKNN